MTAENTEAVVRRLFELGNQKDVDAYLALLHEDFVNHTAPPGIPGDREGYRQIYAMYTNAMPDFKITVDDVIVQGDKGVTRWTVRGTHQGELMGVPPTGNQIEVTGITINRVAEGKIIEQWEIADTLGMMQQIGAIPAPEEAAA